MVATADAEAPNLDQAGEFARRAHPQFFAVCIQMDTVIADQNGGRKLPGTAGQDEIEGETRLAGTGWPADQDRAIADLHRGGMHGRICAHGSGSRTTKRAPVTVGSPSASFGPGRFSAQMRPPCASMICLEIDRPRPEFWPKP